MAFVYAWIVPLWADQILPQLLMEQFDTLPIQCRHIEHLHEGVYNFCLVNNVYTDSTEIFFSKLRSAGLNQTQTFACFSSRTRALQEPMTATLGQNKVAGIVKKR